MLLGYERPGSPFGLTCRPARPERLGSSASDTQWCVARPKADERFRVTFQLSQMAQDKTRLSLTPQNSATAVRKQMAELSRDCPAPCLRRGPSRGGDRVVADAITRRAAEPAIPFVASNRKLPRFRRLALSASTSCWKKRRLPTHTPESRSFAERVQVVMDLTSRLNVLAFSDVDTRTALLSEMLGKPLPATVTIYPPFYRDLRARDRVWRASLRQSGLLLLGLRRYQHWRPNDDWP